MKHYITIPALVIAAYLSGAFIAADWNISNWGVFGRYALAVMIWCAAVFYLQNTRSNP